jgi:hypothetical protein
LQEWDEQISASNTKLEEALSILGNDSLRGHLRCAAWNAEQLDGKQESEFDNLLAELRTAAMVLAPPNLVIAANQAATAIFNVKPQQQLGNWSGDDDAHISLLDAVSAMVREAKPKDHIIQFRPSGSERLIMMHLRSIQSLDRRHYVLAVTSEYIWPEGIAENVWSDLG